MPIIGYSELKKLIEALGREIGRETPEVDCERLGLALSKALYETIYPVEHIEVEEITEAFRRECRIGKAGL